MPAVAETAVFVEPDVIRARFAAALSDMYRAEVPLYADLLAIVADVNAGVVEQAGAPVQARLGVERLRVERHGAIRLGTAQELATMARAFAVMGMAPVGYYDLAPAGVPVHSTAFRPVTEAALAANPFRVFCSLLRHELIDDDALRAEIGAILARRQIFSDAALDLILRDERNGGLNDAEADAFVAALLETFRWHHDATVDQATYQRLATQHRLIADIVAFKGPHINHLTPRTLDIDAAQAEMLARGIDAKDQIEGPPTRAVPILLRQTSFKALTEEVRFADQTGADSGRHTARFGEIEQRGAALTPKGRALYDRLLAEAQGGDPAVAYADRLRACFAAFPDDVATLAREGLIYLRGGEPVTYEDFLPVSAAGIFQSNLAGEARHDYAGASSQVAFEAALGRAVIDPFGLYAAMAESA
ncbi:VOC family protein [Novosphingobium sp.]|uniref:VOC family protein n=1 Tax=Novosphingobium sp. TaxID=1874826 RepID=UPI0033418661